ncbi:MAG TPA: hypothetical protein VM686_10670, partial [Polyangiaceae bacterium]|nr:hypothetical protein [Polyangiaceae bacterium]
MKHAPLALLAVALALTVSGRARAENAITLEGCEALDRELLTELFTLELRTLKLSESRFEIVVSCSEEQATIQVLGAVTGSAPARASVDLSPTAPAARERL